MMIDSWKGTFTHASDGVDTRPVRPSSFRILTLCACAALVTACSDSSSDLRLDFATAPTVAAAGPAPLARSLTVESTVPSTVEVLISDDAGRRVLHSFVESSTSHDLLLLGMRPGRRHQVTAIITDEKGRSRIAAAGEIVTDPLPDDFPNIAVLTNSPERMEPGLTMIEALRRDRTQGYLIVVDERGEVIWYMPTNTSQAYITRLQPDGLILTLSGVEGAIRKIDFAGNVHEAWHTTDVTPPIPDSVPLDGAGLHHDILAMPDGTYLTSTRESIRTVDDFPIDEQDPSVTATVTIREEPVIQFNDAGEIIGKWDFLDMLHPTRIGFNATNGQPNATDWVHLNGIWYDESDDSIMASLRHQDAVVKFDRASGQLIWILGPHENWDGFEQYLLAPVNSPFTWQYHQHAPMLTTEGNLLLFDNGNNRATPFTQEVPLAPEESFSRAVEYRIDEAQMTVEQVWEYGLDQSGEQIYAPFLGDADDLPATGNVLITFGGICTVNGIPSGSLRACRVSARIIEVDRDTHEKVFDLAIDDKDPAGRGYQVYRSDRISGFYPAATATTFYSGN